MTGELAAFMLFVALMLLLIGWLLRRGQRAVDDLHRELDDLKRDPP